MTSSGSDKKTKQSFWINFIAIGALLLALIVLILTINISRLTDSFILHSFEHQRGNRHILDRD